MRLPRYNWIIAVCAALLVILLNYFDFFYQQELSVLDWRFKTRKAQPVSDKIVLIEIADDTLISLNEWPLKRDLYAQLVDVLDSWGARQIIFDILFTENTPEDAAFAAAIGRSKKVFLSYIVEQAGAGQPRAGMGIVPSLLRQARGTGFINVSVDPDGKIRRVPLIIPSIKIFPRRQNGLETSEPYEHLIISAAKEYWGAPSLSVTPQGNLMRIGNKEIPLVKGTFLINFAGPWKKTFAHYSFLDVLLSYQQLLEGKKPALSPALFKDKICLVGLTASGTTDIHSIPLETVYPLIGVGANIYNSLLTNNYVRRVPAGVNTIISVFFILIILLLCGYLRIVTALCYCSVAIVVYLLACTGLFYFLNLWINIVIPSVLGIVTVGIILLVKLLNELHTGAVRDKELDVARQIQMSFLPEIPSHVRDLNVHAQMITAREVGGDFYDSTVTSLDSCVGFLLGDVSGKGVGAALVMAKVLTLFKLFAKECRTPMLMLRSLNTEITAAMQHGLFITAVYCVYEQASSTLIISSAGHLPVIKATEDGTQLIEFKEGLPLGVLADSVFEEKKVSLKKGDVVLLYTDGLIECRNRKGEEFGIFRLRQAVDTYRYLSSAEIAAAIKNDIDVFSDHQRRIFDDFTVMVIKKL